MPAIEFASLILVDPIIGHDSLLGGIPFDLYTPAEKRRDIWPSSDEALKSLQSRPGFKSWDPRILELYIVRAWISVRI